MMEAVEALALVSGNVDQELLVRNEYLAAENRILKSKLKKPVSFNDSERIQLTKIGKRMGLKALKEISCIVKAGDNPEYTIHYHQERNHQGKETGFFSRLKILILEIVRVILNVNQDSEVC